MDVEDPGIGGRAAMWLPAATSQQRARPRRRLLLVCGAAVLAFVFCAGAWPRPLRADGVARTDMATTFVGVRPPMAPLVPGAAVSLRTPEQQLGHVARRAEEEEAGVVDTIVKEEEGEPVSVFDGEGKKTFKQKFNHQSYLVFRTNWTYAIKDESGNIVERGPWARAWNMPEKDFELREKSLKQKYRRKKRKLRIKYGMGQKWPNGKYIFLAKLQGSPFTRQQYGEKYVGWAEWMKSPNEVWRKKQVTRALELKRRLMIEAEETRIERLSQLRVWPGKEEWRKPFRPDVQYSASWTKYDEYEETDAEFEDDEERDEEKEEEEEADEE